MLAIEVKIPIQRPHGCVRPQLRHPDKASIGNPEEAGLDQSEQVIGVMPVTLQQKQRLGDDCFTSQRRGRGVLGLLDNPGVVCVISHQQRNQWTRVNQPDSHRP